MQWMSGPRFADRLAQELEARRARNVRYSLRAFAVYLGTDHSTLSQILRGRRAAPARQIRAWSNKLGLDAEEAAVWVAIEHSASEIDRHWTAEALGIVTGRVHWRILELSRAPEFRPDSRWLAEQIGVSADQVNLAVSRLLRLGLLEMTGSQWKEPTGLGKLTESEFRKVALRLVREKAA
jgi:transcriptional regulator with XRE-family HTH domain